MLYQIEINLPVPPKPTVSDYVHLSQVNFKLSSLDIYPLLLIIVINIVLDCSS